MPVVSIRSRSALPAESRVVRDRTILTLYGPYAVWGWFLYSFSPSVPLLAEDQGISDAQAGLHGTAMAVGGLVAAFLAPRAVAALGRRGAIVVASLAVAGFVTALMLGPSLPWTLGAMLLLAVGGNVLIASAQVGLALHAGPTASAVITEGNAVGSGIGLLGPLAVGAAVTLGWGWRPAVLVTAVLAMVTTWFVHRLPLTPSLAGRGSPGPVRAGDDPQGDSPDGDSVIEPEPAGAALPVTGPVVEPAPSGRWSPGPTAALFLVAIVAAVAVENATTYWSTALLIDRTGAHPGIATAATAGLLAGMTVMRLVAGPLTLRISAAHLLAGGFAVSIAGWAVVWTTTSTGVAMAGLVLAGLGFGVQYPLTIALLLASEPQHSDRAMGQATLYSALAVGVAPFLLGAISDHVDMHTAFLVVPVFAVTGMFAAVAGGRALRKATRPALD